MFMDDVTYGMDKEKRLYLFGLSSGKLKTGRKTKLIKAKSGRSELHNYTILCTLRGVELHKINNLGACSEAWTGSGLADTHPPFEIPGYRGGEATPISLSKFNELGFLRWVTSLIG